MKNFTIFLFLSIAFTGSRCVKSSACTPNSPGSEASQIEAYALSKGITAIAHPSGLYYEIINPGAGVTPSASSYIVITYRGELLDGTVFDERTTPNNGSPPNGPWPLSGLIEGWKVGIPLIKKGGHIKLIVPSSMAYGCAGKGVVPGNSILYFDINLVDVQ